MSTSTPTDRRCKRCHRLTAGHGGKYGPSCTKTPLVVDPATNCYVEPPKDTPVPADSTPVTGSEVYTTPAATVSQTFMYPVPGQDSTVPPVAQPGSPDQAEGTVHAQDPGAEQTTTTQQDSAQQPQNVSVAVPTRNVVSTTQVRVDTTPRVVYTTTPGPMSGVGRLVNPIQMVAQQSSMGPGNTIPIWSNMVRARARPTAPMHPVAAPVQNPDIALLTQQMAEMQSQLARLQTDSGAMPHHMQPSVTAAGAAAGADQYQVSPAQAGLAHPASNFVGQARYPGIATVQAPMATAGWPHGLVAGPPVAPPGFVPGLVDIENLGDLQRYSNVDGLSEHTLRSALRGMYIDLQELLPLTSFYVDESTDLTPVIDPVTGIVSYRYKRPQRKINNYLTWLEAFFQYERMMVQAHGITAYFAMCDYKKCIQDFDKKFHWPSVYNFDIKHRQSLSGRSISFAKMDPTMVASCLDSSTVKAQARCVKCKSVHQPGDCPQLPPRGHRHRSSSRGKQTTEICNNFNTSACTYNGCRRAHKCIGCRGDLPYKVCLTKGTCASSGKQSQQ